MTPDEKKLYALMAVAEQQQEAVNQAVNELKSTGKQIQQVIAGQTQQTVSEALNTGLKEGKEDLIKTAQAMARLKNSINTSSDQLSWKLITLVLGVFAILMFGIVWLFMAYIQPLGTLKQVDGLRQQGIELDLANCTVGKESKTCVRIMKKQCGYGKNGDFCVIDPK